MGGSRERKSKRNLSYELIEANRLSKSLFSTDILQTERNLAELYASTKNDLMVVLVNKDDDEKILAIPYMQRFSPHYAQKIKNKLYRKIAPNLHGFDGFLHVTFTVNWTKYASQFEVKNVVQKAWNKLRTMIRKQFRGVECIKTTEWQENGMGCHLHVLFCGIRRIEKDWLLERWVEKSGYSIELRYVGENWKKAVNYMFKYIAKSSLNVEGKKLSVSQIVNWATFSRSFSVSRGISLGIPKTNSNSEWVFVGVIPLETYNNMSSHELLEWLYSREF